MKKVVQDYVKGCSNRPFGRMPRRRETKPTALFQLLRLQRACVFLVGQSRLFHRGEGAFLVGIIVPAASPVICGGCVERYFRAPVLCNVTRSIEWATCIQPSWMNRKCWVIPSGYQGRAMPSSFSMNTLHRSPIS